MNVFTSPNHRHAVRIRSYLAVPLVLLSVSAAYPATRTWDGDTSTNFAAAGNWEGGVAPSLTTTNDVAEFTGAVAPTNQPNWGLGATNAIGGIVGGDSYATILNLNTSTTQNVVLGSGGIDTGTQLFTLTATSSSDIVRLDISVNQTWTVGEGGLLIDGSGDPDTTLQLIGSGTLTKSGSGDLTWNGGGSNTLQSLVITEGSVIHAGGGRIVNNTGGSITLDGATALLRQNGGNIGGGGTPTTITVGAGGGTFQSTSGPSHTWSANNTVSGIGDFTLDMQFMPASGNLNINGDNSGYSGVFTIANTGINNRKVTIGNADALGDGLAATHGLDVQAAGSDSAAVSISNGINANVGTLSGNSAAIISSADGASNVATLTVNQHESATYAGRFSRGTVAGGTFNLVKSGTGALTLSGDSSSTWDKGGVTINAGTMLVAADYVLGTSQVTVALNNAALASDVTGRILANTITTAGSGSIIDPTGTLTFGGLNATLGMTLSLDSGELLNVAGSFSGAGTDGFVLDLSAGFATGSPVTVVTFGAQSGVDSADFVLSAAASSLYTLDSVTVDGDSVDIVLSAIPEPATCALLIGGLATVFLARRRREA